MNINNFTDKNRLMLSLHYGKNVQRHEAKNDIFVQLAENIFLLV